LLGAACNRSFSFRPASDHIHRNERCNAFGWKLTCKSVVGSGYGDTSYGSTTSGYDRYLYRSDAGIRRLLSLCVNNHEAFYVDAHLRPTYSDTIIYAAAPEGCEATPADKSIFDEICSERSELRARFVARMVVAATLIMLVCMTFRVPLRFSRRNLCAPDFSRKFSSYAATAGTIFFVTVMGEIYHLTSPSFVISFPCFISSGSSPPCCWLFMPSLTNYLATVILRQSDLL
jgi:hypothetical protein